MNFINQKEKEFLQVEAGKPHQIPFNVAIGKNTIHSIQSSKKQVLHPEESC
tara:strand:- start:119 stop:271 length:153 start_codon:yes stop_codon:yes gene_type:complete